MVVECNIISSIWWYNSDRCCLEGGRNPLEIPSSGPQADLACAQTKSGQGELFVFEMCKKFVTFRTLFNCKMLCLQWTYEVDTDNFILKHLNLIVKLFSADESNLCPAQSPVSLILHSRQYLEICISLTVITTITLGLSMSGLQHIPVLMTLLLGSFENNNTNEINYTTCMKFWFLTTTVYFAKMGLKQYESTGLNGLIKST